MLPEAQQDPRVPVDHHFQRLRVHLLTPVVQQPQQALAPPDRLLVPLALVSQPFQSVLGHHYFPALQALQEIPLNLAVHFPLKVLVNHWIQENRKIPENLASRLLRLSQQNQGLLMDQGVQRHPRIRPVRKVQRVLVIQPIRYFRLHRLFRDLQEFQLVLLVLAVQVLQPVPQVQADQAVPVYQSVPAVPDQESLVHRPVLADLGFQRFPKDQTDLRVQQDLVIQLVHQDLEILHFQPIPAFLADQEDQ